MANIAKRLGILVISDEVYGHLTFGCNPFTPMGVFGHTVPVLTLSSISKRWAVPGWRLGWIVANDPYGVLKETKVNFHSSHHEKSHIGMHIKFQNSCLIILTFVSIL